MVYLICLHLYGRTGGAAGRPGSRAAPARGSLPKRAVDL